MSQYKSTNSYSRDDVGTFLMFCIGASETKELIMMLFCRVLINSSSISLAGFLKVELKLSFIEWNTDSSTSFSTSTTINRNDNWCCKNSLRSDEFQIQYLMKGNSFFIKLFIFISLFEISGK